MPKPLPPFKTPAAPLSEETGLLILKELKKISKNTKPAVVKPIDWSALISGIAAAKKA